MFFSFLPLMLHSMINKTYNKQHMASTHTHTHIFNGTILKIKVQKLYFLMYMQFEKMLHLVMI